MKKLMNIKSSEFIKVYNSYKLNILNVDNQYD